MHSGKTLGFIDESNQEETGKKSVPWFLFLSSDQRNETELITDSYQMTAAGTSEQLGDLDFIVVNGNEGAIGL